MEEGPLVATREQGEVDIADPVTAGLRTTTLGATISRGNCVLRSQVVSNKYLGMKIGRVKTNTTSESRV